MLEIKDGFSAKDFTSYGDIIKTLDGLGLDQYFDVSVPLCDVAKVRSCLQNAVGKLKDVKIKTRYKDGVLRVGRVA